MHSNPAGSHRLITVMGCLAVCSCWSFQWRNRRCLCSKRLASRGLYGDLVLSGNGYKRTEEETSSPQRLNDGRGSYQGGDGADSCPVGVESQNCMLQQSNKSYGKWPFSPHSTLCTLCLVLVPSSVHFIFASFGKVCC